MYSIEPTDYICKCGGKIYFYSIDGTLKESFHRCIKCDKTCSIDVLMEL